MTGRKWLGALTLLSILTCSITYGSGPMMESHAVGTVMTRSESSVIINGAPTISGTTIFPGDVLQTRNGATAVLKLRSGARVAMSEQSEVALELASPNASAERLTLHRGAINLTNPSQQTEWVAVPGATVLVKSEGSFPAVCRIAMVGESSAIINDRGHVEIRGSGAPLILPIGQYATLKAGRPQGGSQTAGTVTAAIPAETVERNSQTAPLKLQDAVIWGDLVRTQNTGRVRITLQDGSFLNVGARSEMRVVKHDPQSQQTAIELSAGKVRSQVQKISRQGGSFEVTTQTAVIGVVGTDFIVDSDRDRKKTTVWCIEGSVRVRNLNAAIAGIVMLSAGEMTTVALGMPPAPGTSFSPGSIQAQTNATNPSGTSVATSGGSLGNIGNVAIVGAAGAGAGTAGVAISNADHTSTLLDQAGNTLNNVGNTLNNANTEANNALNSANAANASAGGANGTLTGILQGFVSPTYPCGCH